MDLLNQIVISVGGALGVWLLSSTNHQRILWGSYVGLACEPFWFWTSIINDQWGVFVASILYTGVFIGAIIKTKRELKEIESATARACAQCVSVLGPELPEYVPGESVSDDDGSCNQWGRDRCERGCPCTNCPNMGAGKGTTDV